jgi:hypothetical protein
MVQLINWWPRPAATAIGAPHGIRTISRSGHPARKPSASIGCVPGISVLGAPYNLRASTDSGLGAEILAQVSLEAGRRISSRSKRL